MLISRNVADPRNACSGSARADQSDTLTFPDVLPFDCKRSKGYGYAPYQSAPLQEETQTEKPH